MAQVERHDEHLLGELFPSEELRRGFRVDEDVKLGIGRVVANPLLAVDLAQRRVGEAAADGAAHDAETLDVGRQLGMLAEQGADVGHGARGDDPGRPRGLGKEGLGHGLHAGDGGRRALGGGEEFGAVEAGDAVDVGRGVEGRTLEGLVQADVEGDVFVLVDGCEDGGGIVTGISDERKKGSADILIEKRLLTVL